MSGGLGPRVVGPMAPVRIINRHDQDGGTIKAERMRGWTVHVQWWRCPPSSPIVDPGSAPLVLTGLADSALFNSTLLLARPLLPPWILALANESKLHDSLPPAEGPLWPSAVAAG